MCGLKFSFLLSRSPGVKLKSKFVFYTKCNFLEGDKLFSKVAISFYVSTSNICGSSFFTSLLTLGILFFITAILVGMRWYLTVIFICISLMSNDVKHLEYISHLYVFFAEMSVQIFCLCFNWVVFLIIEL